MKICLQQMELNTIPVKSSWRLNERHYGALQGLNKAETAAEYGEEQVHIWRRSYSVPPPKLDSDDERHPRFDDKYSSIQSDILPDSECLKDTVERFMPYWLDSIKPDIEAGKNMFIVAHSNSLRAIVKILDQLSDKDIISVNIPTGVPLVYELDDEMNPRKSYYLGDQEEISKRTAEVAAQGKNRSI